MPIIEIEKSVLEEIGNVIEQKDKMYENQIAITKKFNDSIEKVYEQEVKKLRNQLQQKDKEIERLNNIINEFDKWLLGEQMMFYRGSDDERLIRFGETKYKWLELKGDSSNE